MLHQPVPHEPGGADRVVVGPHAPVVVADGVEADHRRRKRADAPARERLFGEEPVADEHGFVGVEDAGPEAVAHVRRQRVDRALVAVEAHREPTALLEPEVAVEPHLEVGRAGPQLLGVLVVAAFGREVRTCDERGVHVALHLAQRDRRLGERAGGEADRVVRVLPALVAQATIARAQVLDVAVVVAVAELADPGEGAVGGRQ